MSENRRLWSTYYEINHVDKLVASITHYIDRQVVNGDMIREPVLLSEAHNAV